MAAPEREEIFEIPLQGMSLQELADRLATGQGEIIASLFRKGIMVQVLSTVLHRYSVSCRRRHRHDTVVS